MASIIKRKNRYSVVYTYTDESGAKRQKWELMSRNPVLNATLPKEEHKQREIWTAETLFKALEVCDDDVLVFASSCGRPIEGQVINRALKKLIDEVVKEVEQPKEDGGNNGDDTK